MNRGRENVKRWDLKRYISATSRELEGSGAKELIRPKLISANHRRGNGGGERFQATCVEFHCFLFVGEQREGEIGGVLLGKEWGLGRKKSDSLLQQIKEVIQEIIGPGLIVVF